MSDAGSIDLALGLALAVLAVQRVSELLISRLHQRELEARGAVEFGHGQFPGFVILHTLLPLGLLAEVLIAHTRPAGWWPWLLALLVLAAILRALSMRALGDRWHVRVWVVPGEAAQTHGIYRWMRHPNYVAVTVECAALPLLFGAWRTAIGASLLNVVMLALRIRTEERALAWASQQPATKAVSENAECKAARSDERGVSSDTPQRGYPPKAGPTKPTRQSAFSDTA